MLYQTHHKQQQRIHQHIAGGGAEQRIQSCATAAADTLPCGVMQAQINRGCYEKYPELKEKREEEKKSRELEINKKYTEACADTAEELHDRKVAQEVIEAVEQEEENIIKEAEESKSEVLLDMDKEDK